MKSPQGIFMRHSTVTVTSSREQHQESSSVAVKSLSLFFSLSRDTSEPKGKLTRVSTTEALKSLSEAGLYKLSAEDLRTLASLAKTMGYVSTRTHVSTCLLAQKYPWTG
jgi:hypothetical protein